MDEVKGIDAQEDENSKIKINVKRLFMKKKMFKKYGTQEDGVEPSFLSESPLIRFRGGGEPLRLRLCLQ